MLSVPVTSVPVASVPPAPDAHRLLIRALLAGFPGAALLASKAAPWASATFVGARHEVALGFADPADAAAAGAALGEHEFALRRHLVADLVAAPAADDARRLDIAALTIEDR